VSFHQGLRKRVSPLDSVRNKWSVWHWCRVARIRTRSQLTQTFTFSWQDICFLTKLYSCSVVKNLFSHLTAVCTPIESRIFVKFQWNMDVLCRPGAKSNPAGSRSGSGCSYCASALRVFLFPTQCSPEFPISACVACMSDVAGWTRVCSLPLSPNGRLLARELYFGRDNRLV
jgi:hypothetical protein